MKNIRKYTFILSLINEMYMEKAIVPMLQLLTCAQFLGFLHILYPSNFAWFCATSLPCVLLWTFFLLPTPRIILKLVDFNFCLILLDNLSQILNLSLSSVYLFLFLFFENWNFPGMLKPPGFRNAFSLLLHHLLLALVSARGSHKTTWNTLTSWCCFRAFPLQALSFLYAQGVLSFLNAQLGYSFRVFWVFSKCLNFWTFFRLIL